MTRTRRHIPLLFLLLVLIVPVGQAAPDPLTLQSEGDAAFEAGDMARAKAAYQAALEILLARGEQDQAAAIRHQLAFTELALDRPEAALPLFLANLRWNLKQGRPNWAAPNFLYVGRILLDFGHHHEAIRLLADYPLDQDPDPQRRAEVTHLHLLALEALGRHEDARKLLDRVRDKIAPPAWERHLAGDAERLTPPPPDPLWCLAPPLLALPLLLALIPNLRRHHGHWLLAAFTTFAALTLAELITRQWLPDPGAVRHFLNRPHTVFRFRPAPGVMPGIAYPHSTFTVNDVGLRGEDLAHAAGPRVVVIGGSSVEALFVDDPDAWPSHAQRILARRGRRVWIANAGKSGLDSFAHRIQLHHILREIHPHLVVVQAGVNDLNRCISGGKARLFADARRARRPDFISSNPGVFAQILPPAIPRLALARLFSWFSEPPPPPTGVEAVPQDEAGRYLIEQRRRRRAAEIVHRLPVVDDCLAIYRDNLEALAEMTEQGGATLALFTQGHLYRPDLDRDTARLLWFGSVDVGFFAPTPPRRYYSVAVMAELMNRYNTTLMAVCQAHRLPCLDVDALLPKSTESYYDDVHLNRNGSLVLARHLADFIDGVLFPPPPRRIKALNMTSPTPRGGAVTAR